MHLHAIQTNLQTTTALQQFTLPRHRQQVAKLVGSFQSDYASDSSPLPNRFI